MPKQTTTSAVSKVVALLTPFTSEDRQRVVQAVLTLLGETQIQKGKADNGGGDNAQDTGDLPKKAQHWMKQNKIDLSELEQVFHIENGKANVIASSIPGKNKREKTQNAYVIQGISMLLSSGEPDVDDKTARELCNNLGCYDSANHAVNMKNVGNKLTGSKAKGWKVTAPGLTYGASLVKELSKKTG